MRVLVSWLRDFVEIPETPEALGEALTLSGMAVDGVERIGDEVVFDIDVTSNRPDAMNHFGMAREIAAIFDRPLKRPATEFPEDPRHAADFASIEIVDDDLCPRYVGRVLLGVEVGPSPDWLKRRLELCGLRSINNIADLTNYVLLETGHPTHAFDLDTLNDRRIVVRRARGGEDLRTLDGLDRKLTEDDLVIADAYRPVALAGVMGGLETEISDRTRNVLIEAAWFQPSTIRKTARRFGMHTDASHRFERGADIEAAPWAADRIAGLLGRLSPGVVLSGRIDAYPRPHEPARVPLRRSRMTSILGVEIPDAEAERILKSLEFETEPADGGWRVTIPSHRLDVEREIDVIEEAARIYGFDRVPSSLPSFATPPATTKFEAEERAVRETVRALGYDQTVGYAFISEAEARRFGSWDPIFLRNPFSELAAVMRTTSVPTLLRAVEWNYHRSEPNLRLAEVGRLYKREHGEYEEPPVLTLAVTGMARPTTVLEPGKKFDFYDLKSDVEAVLRRFDLASVVFDERDTPAYYVSGRSARIQSEQALVGYAGEIDPAVLAERKIRQPVLLAEIYLDRLYEVGLLRPQHREIPRLAPVDRDFSLLVPEGIPFGEIRAAIGVMEHLASIEPVEIFRGEQVPDGFYSLLLRASWQRNTETFTDAEVNGYAERIRADLERKLKIQTRQ